MLILCVRGGKSEAALIIKEKGGFNGVRFNVIVCLGMRELFVEKSVGGSLSTIHVFPAHWLLCRLIKTRPQCSGVPPQNPFSGWNVHRRKVSTHSFPHHHNFPQPNLTPLLPLLNDMSTNSWIWFTTQESGFYIPYRWSALFLLLFPSLKKIMKASSTWYDIVDEQDLHSSWSNASLVMSGSPDSNPLSHIPLIMLDLHLPFLSAVRWIINWLSHQISHNWRWGIMHRERSKGKQRLCKSNQTLLGLKCFH